MSLSDRSVTCILVFGKNRSTPGNVSQGVSVLNYSLAAIPPQ